MRWMREEALLTDARIQEWVELAEQSYRKAAGKRAADTLKLRLTLEELLLRFRDTYGAETPCRLECRSSFGRIVFQLSQQGESRDCTVPDEDLRTSYDLLARLGVTPSYSYTNHEGGRNQVTYEYAKKPQKNKMLIQILIAIFAAVLCFMLLGLLPTAAAATVTGIFDTLFSKLCLVLSAMATPLVFFAVINGIAGIGDVVSFGKIGRTICFRMLFTYGLAALLLGVCGLIIFPMNSGSAGGSGELLQQVLQLVLDIIPNNLVTPFTTDNDLQVIVIAVFAGFTLLVLGEKVSGLKHLCEECSELFNKMMLTICKAIPLVAFFGVLGILTSNAIGQLLQMYRLVLLFCLGAVLLILIMILRTCAVTRVPYGIIFQKQLPTLVINLTTSSQVTAFPENLLCCKKKFGIEERVADFGLPIGLVMYMPAGAIFLGSVVWALAFMNGVPIDATVVFKILLVCVVVAIAAPPIPGSAIIVLPIMFASCGLPTEYMSLAIVFATFVGYLLPAINGFCMQLEMLMCAYKLNTLDREVLRRPWSESAD